MRIAVVEDEQKERLLLVDYLRRYEEENQCKFSVRIFTDGNAPEGMDAVLELTKKRF